MCLVGRGDSTIRRNSTGKEREALVGSRGTAWLAAGEPCQALTQSVQWELKTLLDLLSMSAQRTQSVLLGEVYSQIRGGDGNEDLRCHSTNQVNGRDFMSIGGADER